MKVNYSYKATCTRVVDGDTIDAIVDLGFNVFKKIRIRFYGLDTWESRTRNLEEKAKGLKAKSRVESLLEMSCNKFTLISHGVGKYGRCLGEIIVKDDLDIEFNVNDLLISEGHAKEYYGGKKEKFKRTKDKKV